MPGEEYAASLVELTTMELVAQVEAVGAYAAKVRALDHASFRCGRTTTARD